MGFNTSIRDLVMWHQMFPTLAGKRDHVLIELGCSEVTMENINGFHVPQLLPHTKPEWLEADSGEQRWRTLPLG